MFNMWRFYIFISVLMAWSSLQVEGQKNNKLDWNIKLNVPGDAGRDYPTLDAIPRTHFSCAGREPGYYADQETNCQVFRICTAGTTYGFQSFLCPNGTLFNQAVFVCDWWMNVNCQQEIQNNIERFENLKPGPQLLKDVRKMITYPMRNPISNGFVKNNFLVTQTYKPPSELLYPNGALTSSHNNVLYVPSKESFGEHLSNDISFAASTSSPLYSLYRGHQSSQNVQFFNKQSAENTKEDQANVYRTNTPSPTQTTSYGPTNYNKLDSYDNRNSKAFNNQKQQLDFESYRTNQAQSLHAKNNNLINVEAQQNLVSTNIPPTVISKTIAFKSIVPGKNASSPKSRITFKTWILKPKNKNLIIKPTYTSEKFIKSVSEPTPSMSNPSGYDKTKQNYQSSTKTTNDFLYNKKNTNRKQETNPDILYNASPTTFRPNLLNRLYLYPEDFNTTTPPPRYEITTLRSLPNTYIPSPNAEISRQTLSPIIQYNLQTIHSNQKENLLAASSSQSPQYELVDQKNNISPLFTVTKQLKVNTNHNNISFTDVLTKEKIDITVNDIVQDTNKIVQPTSTHQNFAQYQNENTILDKHELKVDNNIVSKEEFESKYPDFPTQSSKIITIPSSHLEPPFETSNNLSENKLSNLPFYLEPVNTIERTVSIKITIPEKIAKIIFKNETSSDDFEVLNTGSSNYLVYANNLATKTAAGLMPIGKLSLGKFSNISNSQDLVFSFLADSLNAAKDYNNIVKQNVITTPTPQVQNYRYSNAEDITRKISELTSTQFTNNNVNSHKTKKIIPPSSQANSQQKAAATRNHHNRPQNAYYHQRQQTPVQKLSHTHSQIRPVDSRLPTINSRIKNLRPTSNHIYSGQLYQHPVPEVTRDYYNLPNIKNNLFTLPKLNGHKNFRPQISNKKQNLPDIEVIPSQQSPFNNRLAQMSNQETFQEHVEPPKLSSFLSSTNGITAQVQDTIRGTLSHPFDNDKQLTYNKDQSFYIFSQLNNNHENNRVNEEINDQLQLQKSNNEKIDTLGLQLIPSIGYKLNDERDKERILSTFQLNEFGSPTGSENLYQEDLTTNVDYSVKHPSSYGASSFTQNQSQRFKNKNSNIEDLDAPEPNGYPKISPQPEFNT
ncbi:uncharacterized protein LOC111002696 isoform X1 [Pieris rapae]|uniref:uncharacterized protein LOC111002696 isoform X1 n=1 Tax=Pieris rapae TaxID=64459 RepID=UPI001E2808C1|nr:uncharacterized protein LOC111002696 isoform X1 [Pieris rapae]